jgi:hypothetical protein
MSLTRPRTLLLRPPSTHHMPIQRPRCFLIPPVGTVCALILLCAFTGTPNWRCRYRSTGAPALVVLNPRKKRRPWLTRMRTSGAHRDIAAGTASSRTTNRLGGSSDRQMGAVDRDCGSAHYAGVWARSFGDRHIGYRHPRMPHVFHRRLGEVSPAVFRRFL